MNEKLNKALGQLEEDLKKLQSARKQVESVIASNKEFVDATNGLVKNTQSLVAAIKESAVKQFAEQLTASKNAVDKVVKDGIGNIESSVKKIDDANQKLKETTETKVKEVSELASKNIKDASNLAKNVIGEQKVANQEALSNFSKQLTEIKNHLQNLFEQAKNNIKQVNQTLEDNATNKIAQLSNLAKITIEAQKQENLKTLNHILETHNQIKQLMGQLLNLDLPNTLKSLNANLEKWQQVSNQQFKTTKTIQISTLAAIGVFGIVIVLKLFGII